MFNISYIEPVFRPPSEARSLILQVTNGCSWNKCTFCDMYTQPQKKFRARSEDEILQEIINAGQASLPIEKVFLADGDAMVLPFRRLKNILLEIKKHLPQVKRVSAYCLPRNLKKKTVEELSELADLGLGILYVGTESGDDEVLDFVEKGESYKSSKDALLKIKEAGIKSSVMILNGLAGPKYSKQHARNSALLMNEVQPDFLSTLVVSFPLGEDRLKGRFDEWRMLNQHELFVELREFLAQLELTNTVYRSDHASNYLPLKGSLGKDKAALLAQLDQAIDRPDQVSLRQEWQRGL